MSSLTAQIAAYTGPTLGYETVISASLTDGIVDVMTKVLALRPEQAINFASNTQVTTSAGLALSSAFPIIEATRSDQPCRFGIKSNKSGYTYPFSMEYATKFDPVYYVDGGGAQSFVYVKPDPTPTEPAWVTHVRPGTVNDAAGTISNFPTNYTPLVVKYASIRVLNAMAQDVQSEILYKGEALTDIGNAIADITGDGGELAEARTAIGGFSSSIGDTVTRFTSYLNARDLLIDEASDVLTEIVAETNTHQSEAQAAAGLIGTSRTSLATALNLYISNFGGFKTEVGDYIVALNTLRNSYANYVDNAEDIELAQAKGGEAGIYAARLQNKLQQSEMETGLFAGKVKSALDTIQAIMSEHGVDTGRSKFVFESLGMKMQNIAARSTMLDREVEVAVQEADAYVKQVGIELKKVEISMAKINGYNARATLITSEIGVKATQVSEYKALVTHITSEYNTAFDAIGGVRK